VSACDELLAKRDELPIAAAKEQPALGRQKKGAKGLPAAQQAQAVASLRT
jgi:hypothetical protein